MAPGDGEFYRAGQGDGDGRETHSYGSVVIVNKNPRIPVADANLYRELQEHAVLLNMLTNGQLAGTNNATTAMPAGGTYAVGDFVRNSAPAEAGGAGSMYVILGWVCTSASPLVFKQCRVLTGN